MAKSRAQRLATAVGVIESGNMAIEELRDELTDWLEGWPENLQSGATAEALETAISELDDIHDNIETACGNCDDIVWLLGFGRD